MARPVQQSNDHVDGKSREVAKENQSYDERQEKEKHKLLHALRYQFFFLLELHTRTAEAVIVTVMMV